MRCLRCRQPRWREVLRGMRRPAGGAVPRVRRERPAREEILRRVRCGVRSHRAICGHARGPVRNAEGVHAGPPGGADPEGPHGAFWRAQASDGPFRRRLRLHVAVREARSRGRARADQPRVRADARRDPPLRGHRQPVPRRRAHGAVRRAHRPRGPRAARRPRRACDSAGARPVPRRPAGDARDRLPSPHGPQHGPGRRRRDRRQPAHGLHRGRRHDQHRGARAAARRARPDRGGRGDPAPYRPLLRDARAGRHPAEGQEPARSGRGQAVFVVGDAGIGKSRLLLEFRRRLGDAATWVEGDCISFGQSIPFLPIVQMLKQNFGIEARDAEAQIIAKILRGLAFVGDEAATIAPYLRYLLSVDPGDPGIASQDPLQRRARILAALQGLTATGSRRRPVVLVVEDAHWIDSASEDFLKSLTESLPGMAVLLIVTYRPVYAQPFGDRTYYWRIGLQPVDEDAAAQIVRATLGVAELPRELAVTIAAKAEGNPFFLEEIGRTLEETGAVRAENGRLVLAQAASTITVPETVQDVIAARLDRLGASQKRTVQTASVIGRESALALLRRVSDLQEQLEQNLTELKRIELIYQKGGFGELEYVFKHALTQDVAYASLLQSERRRLHALIGTAIEEVYAGRLEERAEELAYHFTRGEVWDKVVHYAREAGERAAALFVDDKAVEFYETALAALRHGEETRETARAGIDIRLAMRAPLWRAGRLDPLYERFREAEELAARHGVTE